jgi:hypothetical protein
MLRTSILWLAALSALSAGCDDPADPQWKIDGFRVIAVQADPPEVGPDGVVQLASVDHDSEGRAVSYEWSVCLFSFGSSSNFECVDAQLSFELDSTSRTAALDLSPNGLGLRALYEAFGPVPGPGGQPQTLESGFDIYVHLVATPDGGPPLSTYKRLTVRDGDRPNRNPGLAALLVDDEPAGAEFEVGATVEIRAEPAEDAEETYVDAQTGEEKTETLRFSYLTTAGTIDNPPGPSFNLKKMDLKLPKTPGPVEIFVAVRDERGGVTVAQRTLQVR